MLFPRHQPDSASSVGFWHTSHSNDEDWKTRFRRHSLLLGCPVIDLEWTATAKEQYVSALSYVALTGMKTVLGFGILHC